VSVDNKLSKDTYTTVLDVGSLKAHFVKPGRRADLIISSNDAYHGRTFWVRTSSSGYSSWSSSKWGTDTDIPLVGDIDGDGKGDFIVYSNSYTQSTFWVKTSSSGYKSYITCNWGHFDAPYVADVDGDGKDDFIVWNDYTGVWWIKTSTSGYNVKSYLTTQWGIGGNDTPLIGDVDGDGKADFVIWTSYLGIWWVKTSSSGYSSWFMVQPWGNQLDTPFLAQMDND
jgi:hypothetical protein